jgi:hypothetical protein
MRRLIPLGALLVTATLLAACSGDGPGPLGNGGDPGQQCMPSARSQPTTVGLYDLKNSGSSPVKVQSIRLGSPRGLTMTRAWLTPIYNNGGTEVLVGVGWPWPPSLSRGAGSGPVRWAWARRKPAVGAIIKPHQDLNLVFGLTRTAARNGHSGGPVIAYSANSNAYTVREATTLEITAAKSC